MAKENAMMDIDRLASELAEVTERHQGDTTLLMYALAYRVIRFFLGAPWAERRIRLHHIPDAWMLNGSDEASQRHRFEHMDRVLTLADALFRLSGSVGFEVLVERFKRPNTKQTYIEANVASLFAEEAFKVEIIREKGVRGLDFDFVAAKDSILVSVEVTAKPQSQISSRTLLNTLTKKRDQVPPDKPAILYVQIPTTWTLDGALAEQAFTEAISAHFISSRRFNAIVIIREILIPALVGAVTGLAYRPFNHPNPRYQIPPIHSLTPSAETMDVLTLQQRLLVDPVMATVALQTRTTQPSFVEWLRFVRPDAARRIVY